MSGFALSPAASVDLSEAILPQRMRRKAMEHREVINVTSQPGAGHRDVGDLSRAEPTVVVDDVQDSEPAVGGQLVAHEVERPSLHRPLRHLRRDPVTARQLSPLLGAHLQALFEVEPLSALVVRNQSLAPEQRVQPKIPVGTVPRDNLMAVPVNDAGGEVTKKTSGARRRALAARLPIFPA